MTLGLIADLYEPETQHWPLCFVVLSSTIGTSIGGVIGGPIEKCEQCSQRHRIYTIRILTIIFRPQLAMELLDTAHLWRRRSSHPLLYARKSFHDPHGSRSEASPQER